MPFRPLRASVNDGNFGDVLSGALTTTTNAAAAVASYAPPANAVAYFSCTFVGRRTDGANAGDGAVVTLTCAYKNVAGVLTQIGADASTVVQASASINTSAASSSAASGVVSLKIAGVNGATINWQLQSALTYIAQ